MTILESFGKRLRELRQESGLNQIQLAEKLGVSRGSISFYENAERMPDLNLLERAAGFFDVTIDYLLGRNDFETRQVKRERDAAVADLYHMGGCPNCTHNKGRNPHTGVYMCKKHMEFPNGDCFKWRGVKEG